MIWDHVAEQRDEAVASAAERDSNYWTDGVGELVPFCSECAKREFAPEARASGLIANYSASRRPKGKA